MHCAELMVYPWTVSERHVLAELRTKEVPACIPTDSLRAKPRMWTAEQWRSTYNFPDTVVGFDLGRTDIGLREKFSQPPSEKNGYRIDVCTDPRLRRVLEFLVPVFSPDKPHTVTMGILRTIYGAYTGKRMCGWQHLLCKMVERELAKLGNKKGCPLAPYLMHLYAHAGVLTRGERDTLELQRMDVLLLYPRPTPYPRTHPHCPE